jgi:hypothetical protein
MEHLDLPVLDTDESTVVGREVLEVEPLLDGGFRLLHSPAFVWGIAAGDVIDLVPSELTGFRLRSRAGNVAVVAAVSEDTPENSDLVQALISAVDALGGVHEGGPGNAMVFTIPVRAGFGRIEAAFNSFTSNCAGASWWYGNVLDKHDQPLRWWDERSSDRG